MTNFNDNPIFAPFLQMWNSYAGEMTRTAETMMGSTVGRMNPIKSAQQMQQQWLDAMSDSMDAFLRSPQFLEWMRHNSDFAVKAKEQTKNFGNEFARNTGVPTADDISGLFERLHSVEEKILSRMNGAPTGGSGASHEAGIAAGLERIEKVILARLDRLEDRLKSLETSAAVPANRKAAAPQPPTQKAPAQKAAPSKSATTPKPANQTPGQKTGPSKPANTLAHRIANQKLETSGPSVPKNGAPKTSPPEKVLKCNASLKVNWNAKRQIQQPGAS